MIRKLALQIQMSIKWNVCQPDQQALPSNQNDSSFRIWIGKALQQTRISINKYLNNRFMNQPKKITAKEINNWVKLYLFSILIQREKLEIIYLKRINNRLIFILDCLLLINIYQQNSCLTTSQPLVIMSTKEENQQLNKQNQVQQQATGSLNKENTESNVETSETSQIQKLTQNLKISEEQKGSEKLKGKNQNELQENNKSSQKDSESTQLTETKYFININRNNIPFGKTTLFPGSIQQVDVIIQLKDDILEDNQTNNPFMLRVIAKCKNQEFSDLDEYVFSVRSNERFEYFEEVRFKIRKKEKAQVKVAVKIPPVKQNYVIEGFLEVQLQGLQPVCYPIVAKCEVPQIVCIKDLYKPEQDTQIIKIPGKKNQLRMPPIPFKNLSNFNFTLQVQAISSQSFQDKPYDIITQSFVNCQANTQFFVNLQLKQNMSYKGPLPTKDTIRKILILKIKNSSVYFNYPLEVFVFEGTHGGGMN